MTVSAEGLRVEGSPDAPARKANAGRAKDARIGKSRAGYRARALENPLLPKSRIGSQGEVGTVLLDCPRTARSPVLPG